MDDLQAFLWLGADINTFHEFYSIIIIPNYGGQIIRLRTSGPGSSLDGRGGSST
jgi:hypothetical protein